MTGAARASAAAVPAGRAGARRLLNLGCGRRFRPEWTNVDAQPGGPGVLVHDVRQGIPFPDESFDLVYHSHLLEHLTPEDGARLLRECHRVLAPGGTVRVAVPDLEQIARLYLHALERVRAGDDIWRHHYDWLLIELLDQSVRETSGGRHGAYLNRDVIPNLEFVLARHGREAEESIEGQKAMRAAPRAGDGDLRAAAPRLRSLRRLARGLWRLRSAGGRARLREAMLQRLLGEEYQALQLGRFRRSGEIHQWMYDGYSLSRALIGAGFIEPRTRRPDESRVGNWAEIGLDADGSGRPLKPDSIVVEAIKPAGPGAGAR